MEVKIVVSTFLRRFRVSLSPTAAKPVPSMQSALKSLNGITLQISSR